MNPRPTTTIQHFLLLDESRHMRPYQLHVIHQVNQTIHSIRAEALRNPHQIHRLTIATCNEHMMRCLYTREDVMKVQLINRNQFEPNSQANVYDGIGCMIATMRVYQQRYSADQFHFNVFTRGEDDLSSKYTPSMVATLVSRSRQLGWVFSVIGTGALTQQWADSLNIPIFCKMGLKDRSDQQESVMRILKRRWLRQHGSVEQAVAC